MNKFSIIYIWFLLIIGQQAYSSKSFSSRRLMLDTIPVTFTGNFTDDYGIRYSITDSLWTQHSGINYHIIRWNSKEQYIIARNDKNNSSEVGLYTRIDYMLFQNMEPYHWGFCLTVYNATSDTEAETKAQADRENPKKGCGGFPFSRMKREEN